MVNFEQWVVDGRGNPVPMGIAGKLYVGGIGVARGYHDRPELTAERFVTLPWAADPAALLPQRRPGDVAVQRLAGLSRPYRPEVKLRGFRIELGEIESALRRHADVANAAVAVRDPRTGQRQLAAYVFPATAAPFTEQLESDMRRHLEALLPDYMVPAIFMAINKVPATPSGKVDRTALPAPVMAHRDPRAAWWGAPQGHAAG